LFIDLLLAISHTTVFKHLYVVIFSIFDASVNFVVVS
jgi:hypothetical protein